jgi:hypothetical protein
MGACSDVPGSAKGVALPREHPPGKTRAVLTGHPFCFEHQNSKGERDIK